MKRFALVLFASALLASCKNDLDVLDDYKETMVVYGILDAKDTAQYIKINKAYLGEGNALTMAQQFDSLNYDTAKLEVKLERWKSKVVGGTLISTSILKPDFSIPKDAGTFSNPNQILYKTKDAIFNDSEYKLVIRNKVTNNVVTAITSTIGSYAITSPPSGITCLNFTGAAYETSQFIVKWNSAVNGKRYEAFVRFYYSEEDASGNIDSTNFVEMSLSTVNAQDIKGGESLKTSFYGKDFFSFVGSAIKNRDNSSIVKRYPGKIQVIVYAITEDFATYIDVSAPSTGIVQEKPEYTNIQNGVGIFAYRTKVVSSYNKTLISSFPIATGIAYDATKGDGIDSLSCGQFTKNLKFQYYRINGASNGIDTLSGCPPVAK